MKIAVVILLFIMMPVLVCSQAAIDSMISVTFIVASEDIVTDIALGQIGDHPVDILFKQGVVDLYRSAPKP